METSDKPKEAILQVDHNDALFSRSKGGLTYNGWKCDHLPYLVEFDNYVASRQAGQAKAGGRQTSSLPGIRWYYVNNQSPAVPEGFGDEDVIREIWANGRTAKK